MFGVSQTIRLQSSGIQRLQGLLQEYSFSCSRRLPEDAGLETKQIGTGLAG